jgi:hypothetical protein
MEFAEAGDIGIVIDEGRLAPGEFSGPTPQRKLAPAGDMMRKHDLSRSPVGRTAKADADGVGPAAEGGQGSGDLLPDTLRAARLIHFEAVAFENLSGGGAADDLQLGAADLKADQVGRGHGASRSAPLSDGHAGSDPVGFGLPHPVFSEHR